MTFLIWDDTNYSWLPASVVTETNFESGSMTHEICDQGGDRLLDYSSLLTLMIQPNPAEENLEIKVTALEVGKHTLEMFNVHGSKTVIVEWNVTLDGEKEFTFNPDISKFSSGSYFVILKSPTDSKVESVFIIK
jgi:hypothetical protein